MDERALEAAARALACACLGGDYWTTFSNPARAAWIKNARACIAAYLEASGEARDAARYRYWRDDIWFSDINDLPDDLVTAESAAEFDARIDNAIESIRIDSGIDTAMQEGK